MYEDAGDGYAYETGEYTLTRLQWSQSSATLTADVLHDGYPSCISPEVFNIIRHGV